MKLTLNQVQYLMHPVLKEGAMVSSARLTSSFEMVAHKVFGDHRDIFKTYTEMGNDECQEMQWTFHGL
jgi:hypothetical protein